MSNVFSITNTEIENKEYKRKEFSRGIYCSLCYRVENKLVKANKNKMFYSPGELECEGNPTEYLCDKCIESNT